MTSGPVGSRAGFLLRFAEDGNVRSVAGSALAQVPRSVASVVRVASGGFAHQAAANVLEGTRPATSGFLMGALKSFNPFRR